MIFFKLKKKQKKKKNKHRAQKSNAPNNIQCRPHVFNIFFKLYTIRFFAWLTIASDVNFTLVVVRINTKRNCAGKITRFHALLVIAFGFRNTPPNNFCYVSTCKDRHFVQNMYAITFTLRLNWCFFSYQCKIY